MKINGCCNFNFKSSSPNLSFNLHDMAAWVFKFIFKHNDKCEFGALHGLIVYLVSYFLIIYACSSLRVVVND